MIGALGEACDTCIHHMMYVHWLHICVGFIVHCAQVRIGCIYLLAALHVLYTYGLAAVNIQLRNAINRP